MTKSLIHAQKLSDLLESKFLSGDNVVTSKILDLFSSILVVDYYQSKYSKGSGRLGMSILMPNMQWDIGGMTIQISSIGGFLLPNGLPKLDLSFEYNIPILDLAPSVSLNELTSDPKGFVKGVLSNLKSNAPSIGTELLQHASLYIDFEDLINHLSSSFSISNINDIETVTDLVKSLPQSIDKLSVFIDAFKDLLTEEQLIKVLISFLNVRLSRPIYELSDLFKPYFRGSMHRLHGIIKFPREHLLPINSSGEIIDAPEQAAISFGNCEASIGTDVGFSFKHDIALSTLQRFGIGKTGLIISVSKLKLDLSDNKNLAEIGFDGRPISFKGVYIEEASVTFPKNWKVVGDKVINAKNLIVGNEGGVSGNFQVEGANEEYYLDTLIKSVDDISIDYAKSLINVAVENDKGEKKNRTFQYNVGTRSYFIRDKVNRYYMIDEEGAITTSTPPTGVLQFRIGNKSTDAENLFLTLDSFTVNIRQNKVIDSSCVGRLDIPRKDEEGNPKPLQIRVTVDFNDGFLVKAYLPNQQALVDKKWLEVHLGGIELGKVGDKKHFAFSGSADIKPRIKFLKKFLPERIDVKKFLYQKDEVTGDKTTDYNIGMSWKSGTSLTIGNDAPAELIIPIHKSGDGERERILSIKALKVQVEKRPEQGVPADEDYKPEHLYAAATFIEAQLKLGVVSLTLSDLGFESETSFPDGGGNYGDAQVDIGFKPPTKGAISIKSGTLNGGGSIEYNKDTKSFKGSISLSLNLATMMVQINGYVILETQLPDGKEGNSLLIMLNAVFFPPIELGAKVLLVGVGGIFGLNRRADTDAILAGVHSGSLDSAMFPFNPQDKTLSIIDDIEQFFPVANDRFVAGPMVKMAFGSPVMLLADMGVIFEFPSPIKIAILGKAVLFPSPSVLIKFRFAAIIDFGKKLFSLDANIYESKINNVSVDGDIVCRIKWGNNKNFILSVGGFHPAYKIPELGIPEMSRVKLTIKKDNPLFKLSANVYTAITSNTVQFGGELFLFYGGEKFNAKARLWLDALFKFNPFHFMVNIGAEAGIFLKEKSLVTAYLDMNLQGPGPYITNGSASFKAFGLSASISFNKTFGEEDYTKFDPVKVWEDILHPELNNLGNWIPKKTETTNDWITLKELEVEDPPLVLYQPNGGIEISQKVVPSNMVFNKFGNTRSEDMNKFEYTKLELAVGTSNVLIDIETIQEEFAPADFIAMSDEEKLSSDAYVKKDAGIRASKFDKLVSRYVKIKDVKYELIEIDKGQDVIVTEDHLRFPSEVEYANDLYYSTPNNTVSSINNTNGIESPEVVTVSSNTYTVINNETLSQHGSSTLWFNDKIEVEQYLADTIKANPQLQSTLEVVDNFEFSTY